MQHAITANVRSTLQDNDQMAASWVSLLSRTPPRAANVNVLGHKQRLENLMNADINHEVGCTVLRGAVDKELGLAGFEILHMT